MDGISRNPVYPSVSSYLSLYLYLLFSKTQGQAHRFSRRDKGVRPLNLMGHDDLADRLPFGDVRT
jgi:hypothetical protein